MPPTSHSQIPRSLAALGCLAAMLLAAFPLAAQPGNIYSGSVGEGIRLFLPPGLPPDKLPVSLALAQPLPPPAPSPSPGWTLTPEFSAAPGGRTRATLTAPAGTSFYGEGEVTGPLLRNNTDITLWNTDNFAYSQDGGRRLYQSHPWILGVRPDGSAFGFLADTTYRAEIKITDTLIDFLSDGPAFPVLIVDRPSPQDVLRSLGKLIGTMPLPPRWAIGYHQCRYSYESDVRVRQVADEFRARHIPCDVIWMDIDYMNGYRDFTIDHKTFPDPVATNGYLHAHGFHSVWIIDPGVKAEPDYSIFDSGTAAGVWVKNAGGVEDYRGKVWPGECVFPDFTYPAACTWWAGLYQQFMPAGIDGIWNDMNEPAVFDGPDHTMPIGNRHRGGVAGLPAGTEAQYHNVYGMLEVRATREGIAAANPDKRPFVLSRAGFLGSQRYAATWTGDNRSTWDYLRVSIPMSLSLGLAGQPMSGPDCGGFGDTATPELWANWIAVDAFFPFCRGHASKGTPAKEPWAFGEETERAARTALERRYRLLPYLYTLFHASSLDGLPVMRPVFMADPKDTALRAEQTAFTVGADLLIVPKWADQPRLPGGIWRSVSLAGEDVARDKYQPDVRVRGGAIVPLGKVVQSTAEESLDPLTLLVCLDAAGQAEGTLYEDAGDGYGYEHGDYLLTTYHAERAGDGAVVVSVAGAEGRRARPKRGVVVEVLTEQGVARGAGTEEEPIKVSARISPPE
jgi:alpha-glucosidase